MDRVATGNPIRSSADRLASRFRLRITTDVGDAALWERWATFERDAAATAYQMRTFVEPLVRQLAPALGYEAFLAEISDDAGPALMAAFVRSRKLGARVVEFADCGFSDWAGPLLRRGLRLSDADVAALEATLREGFPPHDAVMLRRLQRVIAGEPNPFAAFAGATDMGGGTLIVNASDTAKSPPAWLKDTERKMRKLVREGGSIRRIEDRAEAERVVDLAIGWKLRHVAETGGPNPLGPPAVQAFYRTVIADGVTTGHSVLHVISASERIVGVVQGFVHAGRHHSGLMSVDRDAPESRTFSPGTSGMLSAIRHHAEMETGPFDLGAGNSEYKSRLHGTLEPQLMVTRIVTPLGLAPVVKERAHAAARRWMRAHPEQAARIRRWRGL